MKTIIIISILLFATLAGCEGIDTAEVSINGTQYKVSIEEVRDTTPSPPLPDEEIIPPAAGSTSIRPPVTKYIITGNDGVVYLAETYDKTDKINLPGYWLKNKDGWVYSDNPLTLPFNVRIQNYPQNPEYGYDLPNGKCYIETSDGKYYVIDDRSSVIPVSDDTVRIHHYFVQEERGGRWYFYEGTKDLLRVEIRFL